jgi:transcriptional regulator with XRE-family HTH domain
MTEALTAAQIRAARALLAWSQQDLAKQARLAPSTVADFERGHRTPLANNADAMRAALEGAGVTFPPGGAVVGPSPELPRKAQTGGAPVRWINATDLAQWAERRDGQGSMPELLTRLVRAAVGQAARLHFPSDESIQLPGWDGTCAVELGTEHIPSGASGWEIGTQREDITGKADRDYQKRTAEPLELVPALTTFVFVTPRRWNQKEAWASARRNENKWADVRAYDADDLVHWIELYPAVGNWLATTMRKRPSGVRQLEEVWEEWSLSTTPRLSTDLILAGRDEEAARVLRWLQGEPSVLSVQAESSDEAVAFLHASIQQLPPDYRTQYEARVLVATAVDSARMLGDSLSPLIVVLNDAEPGVAHRLIERGHHVYAAYGSEVRGTEDICRLPRPPRDALQDALRGMGLDENRAERLAKDSGRSLAILRRLMPAVPTRLPRWAGARPAPGVVGALLAGAWNEDSAGDTTALERLGGAPYAAIAADLSPLVVTLDSPIMKIGTTWKIASRRDSWFLLAQYLTSADVDRLLDVAFDVLATPSPLFDIEAAQRNLAAIKGAQPVYSLLVRHGLLETLVLLTLFPGQLPGVSNTTRLRAERIVQRLLRDADRKRWWSLAREFQLLAELSPDEFLAALEDSLDGSDPAVSVLFEEDGGPFGGEHISTLLWALESLAWSPQHLARTAAVLARLAAIDPGGRFSNRPANSLRSIFILWLPQTHATLDERLRVLDRIRKSDPAVAWKLMLGILPTGHDSLSPSPQPRWRDFALTKREEITYPLIARGSEELSRRLLEDVGVDAGRWKELIEALPNLLPHQRLRALTQLRTSATSMSDDRVRLEIGTALQKLLHRHRAYPAAGWALPANEVDELEAARNALHPSDPVQKYAWLFEQRPDLPNPTGKGYRADEIEALRLQREAVVEVLSALGTGGIFALAAAANVPGFVGRAIAHLSDDPHSHDEILTRGLNGSSHAEHSVAHGMILELFQRHGQTWAVELLQRSQSEGWSPEAITRIFLALPHEQWTWTLAASFGRDIEDAYWKRVPLLWINGEHDAFSFAIRQLLEVGRARHAVDLAGQWIDKGFDSGLLVEVLTKAASEPVDSGVGRNDIVMFQHHVVEILKHLDHGGDVSDDDMARLEWNYLSLLEYSDRPPMVLHKVLATRAEFFVEVICAIFRASKESGLVEEPPVDSERARTIASHAFDLLQSWERLPGTAHDGTIDAAALEGWVRTARILCSKVGRGAIGDQQIGQILAAAPADSSGVWPIVAVREVIETSRSRELETGLLVGVHNRRGVTSRGPTDGGMLETQLSKQYREWSEATAIEWPRTAAVLDRIAKDYEEQAHWHDHDAERVHSS